MKHLPIRNFPRSNCIGTSSTRSAGEGKAWVGCRPEPPFFRVRPRPQTALALLCSLCVLGVQGWSLPAGTPAHCSQAAHGVTVSARSSRLGLLLPSLRRCSSRLLLLLAASMEMVWFFGKVICTPVISYPSCMLSSSKSHL